VEMKDPERNAYSILYICSDIAKIRE